MAKISKINYSRNGVSIGEDEAGHFNFKLQLKGDRQRAKDNTKELIAKATQASAEVLEDRISVYTGELAGSVKSSVESEWYPGGAGGGGNWRTTESGVSVGQGVEHSKWYFKGTGLYRKQLIFSKGGISATPDSQGVIYPENKSDIFGPIDPGSYKKSGDALKWIGKNEGQTSNWKILRDAARAGEAVIKAGL